jgi:hypothetical protein
LKAVSISDNFDRRITERMAPLRGQALAMPRRSGSVRVLNGHSHQVSIRAAGCFAIVLAAAAVFPALGSAGPEGSLPQPEPGRRTAFLRSQPPDGGTGMAAKPAPAHCRH